MRLEQLLSGALALARAWNLFLGSDEKNNEGKDRQGFVIASLRLPVLRKLCLGGLAQLARALAWHARGHRFDPDILHIPFERVRDL